jgi:cytochrome c-type biogenesis protein CcmF
MWGFAILVLSSIVSEITLLFYLLGALKERTDLRRYGALGVKIIFGLLTTATIYLVYQFLVHDFQNLYVANNSSRSLPLIYLLSALWAGQEGSLLFWGWLVSICILVVNIKSKPDDKFEPYVNSIQLTTLIFFLLTMIFANNPFERLNFMPADGSGLNPLLQDLGMVFHPPTLFVGYAAVGVPFAYAIAGLIKKDESWLSHIRGWTLVSWLFLSLGIALGGWWSYHVLGWGGYWAWDPVENASLMPWLILTAFLHSVIIQEGKKGMKLWNMILITFSFLLVLYATFLTRSGIIQSVHSFAGSAVAQFFSTFTGLSMLATSILIISRYKWLKSRNIFEAYLSKESAFLFNNLIFMVLTLLILIGTTFPIISEAVRGYQVRVGPGYFNQTAAPLAMIMVFLMGLCPLIAWRHASVSSLKRNLTFPIVAALATTAILYFLGVTQLGGIIVSSSMGFVLGSIIQEFYRATDPDEPMPIGRRFTTLIKAFKRNQRRYGGYVIHLSMIIILGGIAGSTLYEQSKMVTLGRGETFDLDSYTFEMTDIYSTREPERIIYGTQVNIYRDGLKIVESHPTISRYEDEEATIRSPHIHTSGLTDLYVIYESSTEGRATFTFKLIPQVNLIWIGILVGLVGSIISAWPVKRR